MIPHQQGQGTTQDRCRPRESREPRRPGPLPVGGAEWSGCLSFLITTVGEASCSRDWGPPVLPFCSGVDHQTALVLTRISTPTPASWPRAPIPGGGTLGAADRKTLSKAPTSPVAVSPLSTRGVRPGPLPCGYQTRVPVTYTQAGTGLQSRCRGLL